MYANCSQACTVACSCTACFSCRVTFPQGSESPEITDITYKSKECCTGSKASLQAVSAKVFASENGCVLAVAFKEVPQLGISQWKFPANISHRQYWSTEPHFIILLTLLPGNIKIAYTVTKEMRKENPNRWLLHFVKTISKLDLSASASRYIEKVQDDLQTL